MQGFVRHGRSSMLLLVLLCANASTRRLIRRNFFFSPFFSVFFLLFSWSLSLGSLRAGRSNGKGLCIVEACLVFVPVREKICKYCYDFRTAVQNSVETSKQICWYETRKNNVWYEILVPSTYDYEYFILRWKPFHLSVLGHFSGTYCAREAERVGAFVKWHQTFL